MDLATRVCRLFFCTCAGGEGGVFGPGEGGRVIFVILIKLDDGGERKIRWRVRIWISSLATTGCEQSPEVLYQPSRRKVESYKTMRRFDRFEIMNGSMGICDVNNGLLYEGVVGGKGISQPFKRRCVRWRR